ncbi:CHAT domain-containing protein [Fusarium flagelliforme]|nr:CHAT domain-containing protein [Fusarium flagelliforme]KAH7173987.1 CHAT domain-containing protein [Fusarium flagelliforme]
MADLSMVNRRHEASREFNDIIEQIRAKDGFHDFFQPPPAESLMVAAESGPVVVINVSRLRCDAILVERHTIRLFEMPGLIYEEIEEYARNILSSKHNPWPLLEWLWAIVCRPCLDALEFTEPLSEDDRQWPHIWWVPTGLLSQLPFHAAGIYTPGSKETVLDRLVSSYASSLKTLQHGRRRQAGMLDDHAKQNDAILVAMEQTRGQMSLPNARTEIEEVRAVCPLLHLHATTPPRRKADILEHLKNCNVLHFAGHGESARDPSQSRLLLDDWETNPLTVGDLRGSWLQESPAFLAYFSVCSTGSNQGKGLAD